MCLRYKSSLRAEWVCFGRHACVALKVTGKEEGVGKVKPVGYQGDGQCGGAKGFFAFFVGGVCSPLTGLGNMLYSTALIILACAGCTLLLTMHKNNPVGPPTHPAEK